MTFGEKAVGLTFNPSNNPDVQAIKEVCAKVIDLCNDGLSAPLQEGMINNDARNRMLKIAITEVQTAQMWAVKAVTWKDTPEPLDGGNGGQFTSRPIMPTSPMGGVGAPVAKAV